MPNGRIAGTLFIMTACALALSLPAFAATYHVSPFGSNTPPFDTYAKAATHPRIAVDSASGYGDTVLFHTGSYDVDTAITLPPGLVVHGVSRDSSRLVWTGPSFPTPLIILDASSPDHEIFDLELANPMGQAFRTVAGVFASTATGRVSVHDCDFIQTSFSQANGDTLLIYNCLFELDFNFAIVTGGFPNPSRVEIWNNTFKSTSGTPSGVYARTYSLNSTVIRNNVFDLSGSASGGKRGDGLYCRYSSQTLTVRNNLFIGGERAAFWLYTEGVFENNTVIDLGRVLGQPTPFWVELESYQTILIRNNFFHLEGRPPAFTVCSVCGPGAKINYWYNAFWPPQDSFYTTEPPAGYLAVVDSANFNAYPMFIDDSLFNLQAGSPLINCGDPSVLDSDGSRSDVGWTGGPGSITYDYPQLSPFAPDSLWADGANGIISLVWSSRPEADLASYRLYRGASSGFWMRGMAAHREYGAGDTTAIDTVLSLGESYYYVVTAKDTAGLESGSSKEASYIVSGVFDDPGMTPVPRTPYISRAYPNPFNSAVTLDINIPDIGSLPADVEIRLYDVNGRVAAIAFRGQLGAGSTPVTVSPVDSAGRELASGVYFARLKVWSSEFGHVMKLVLIK